MLLDYAWGYLCGVECAYLLILPPCDSGRWETSSGAVQYQTVPCCGLYTAWRDHDKVGCLRFSCKGEQLGGGWGIRAWLIMPAHPWQVLQPDWTFVLASA